MYYSGYYNDIINEKNDNMKGDKGETCTDKTLRGTLSGGCLDYFHY